MKKVYCRPGGVIEYFTPNDYIASACKSGEVYKFKCDAGDADGKYDVVIQRGWRYENLTKDPDGYTRYFHPCEITHDASTRDDFIDGWLVNDDGDDDDIYGATWTPVKVWRGEDGKNVHCTTNLKMDTWEVARS